MSDDVSLRVVREADLPIIFEYERDPEAVHMAAFTAKDPSDEEAFTAHWTRIMNDETVVVRTIVVGESVVGSIARFERDGDTEVTYWIGREHWGRGIATQALALLLEEIKTRPIHARAAKDNVASLRVLEKCGFTATGHDKGYANARNAEIEEAILQLG